VKLATLLHLLYQSQEYLELYGIILVQCFSMQENEKRQKQEEQAAQRTVRRSKSDSKKRSLEAVNSEVCLVDQLMQEIRSGTFKLRRSEG